MLRRSWFALLAISLAVGVLPAQEKKENTATKPAPKDVKRHETFQAIAKKGNFDLVLLGDSITDAWGGEGHNPNYPGAKLFQEKFEPLKTANFGISGDRTQHVLWRLRNGALQGLKPKVVMLMIGTNNSNGQDNTAEEIAEGIQAIVAEIHQQSPATKVLLLGVFPRHTAPTEEARKAQTAKINQVNSLISKLDDGGKKVKYLDIGKAFLDADGAIPRDVMPDQLHLSAKGYQLWYDAVKEVLEQMLKS